MTCWKAQDRIRFWPTIKVNFQSTVLFIFALSSDENVNWVGGGRGIGSERKRVRRRKQRKAALQQGQFPRYNSIPASCLVVSTSANALTISPTRSHFPPFLEGITCQLSRRVGDGVSYIKEVHGAGRTRSGLCPQCLRLGLGWPPAMQIRSACPIYCNFYG